MIFPILPCDSPFENYVEPRVIRTLLDRFGWYSSRLGRLVNIDYYRQVDLRWISVGTRKTPFLSGGAMMTGNLRTQTRRKNGREVRETTKTRCVCACVCVWHVYVYYVYIYIYRGNVAYVMLTAKVQHLSRMYVCVWVGGEAAGSKSMRKILRTTGTRMTGKRTSPPYRPGFVSHVIALEGTCRHRTCRQERQGRERKCVFPFFFSFSFYLIRVHTRRRAFRNRRCNTRVDGGTAISKKGRVRAAYGREKEKCRYLVSARSDSHSISRVTV